MFDNTSLSTDALRPIMRNRRDGISIDDQYIAARRLANQIATQQSYQQSQNIAVYWSVGGEIDLQPLIELAWQQNKHCYLPVIEDQSLVFVRYESGTAMKVNRFGIPEPKDIIRSIAANDLDLVLVPLVAFDSDCHRVGMGGGYYDRTFSFLNNAGDDKRTYSEGGEHSLSLMGVAHACQQVKSLAPEPWDVALHQVVTDRAEFSR